MNQYLNEFPEEIAAPESDYLYTMPSGLSNAGIGLFTAIEIHENEIIAIFKGEILTENESKLRAEKNEDAYFVKLVDGNIMDSALTDCFAKYANDAEGFGTGKLTNNAKIALNEQNVVCLVATKKIKLGQEIFTSYGKKYWSNFVLKNKNQH